MKEERGGSGQERVQFRISPHRVLGGNVTDRTKVFGARSRYTFRTKSTSRVKTDPVGWLLRDRHEAAQSAKLQYGDGMGDERSPGRLERMREVVVLRMARVMRLVNYGSERDGARY